VPGWVINELKERCARGPIELPTSALSAGEHVRVTEGAFRDFEGIFERYLSGKERVAILLSAIGGGVRAVLPANMIVPVG
jgi:transcription antitermination factor NusG